MKIFLPLINIILAASLFYFFTDQMVIKAPLAENLQDMTKSAGGINALKQKKAVLNEAITAARQLSLRVQKLNQVFISFTPDQLAKLNTLLPGNVDNIQLIINVNDIARKSGMSIKDVKISTDADLTKQNAAGGRSAATLPPTISSAPSGVGSVYLSFSVTGTYEAFKSFVINLSHSLRIIDLTSLSFVSTDNGIYTYNVGLKTYWLR
ncbi:MAG: hypothetical protein AAB645_02730 [Patescibacteria group bacterium]